MYARSKSEFREGTLEFRDEEFSDNLAELCFELQTNHDKASFALQGLRMWAFNKLNSKEIIDWRKLKSRLNKALRQDEDKKIQGREDFKDFVNKTYTAL